MGSKKKAKPIRKKATKKKPAGATRKSGKKLAMFRLAGPASSSEYLFAHVVEAAKGGQWKITNIIRGICTVGKTQKQVQTQEGVGTVENIGTHWTWIFDDHASDEIVVLEATSVVYWRYIGEKETMYDQHEGTINQRREQQALMAAEEAKQRKLAEIRDKQDAEVQ